MNRSIDPQKLHHAPLAGVTPQDLVETTPKRYARPVLRLPKKRPPAR